MHVHIHTYTMINMMNNYYLTFNITYSYTKCLKGHDHAGMILWLCFLFTFWHYECSYGHLVWNLKYKLASCSGHGLSSISAYDRKWNHLAKNMLRIAINNFREIFHICSQYNKDIIYSYSAITYFDAQTPARWFEWQEM